MNAPEAAQSVRRLYWLTGSFGIAGFVSYLCFEGLRSAVGFALGALGSFGNLWLFERLARGIAPGDAPRKPWQAGAFAARYLVLFTIAYAIIKGLRVNPLAVVLGLLASTAAVIISSIVELIASLAGGGRTD
jgi:hypothetical protein